MGKKGKNYDEKALFDEPDVSISSGSWAKQCRFVDFGWYLNQFTLGSGY